MAQTKDIFSQIAEALAGVGQTGLEAIGGAGDRFIKDLTGGNAVQEIPSSARKVGPTPIEKQAISGMARERGAGSRPAYLKPRTMGTLKDVMIGDPNAGIVTAPVSRAEIASRLGQDATEENITSRELANKLYQGRYSAAPQEMKDKGVVSRAGQWLFGREGAGDGASADETTPTVESVKPSGPPQNVPRETFKPQGDILGGLKKLAWDDRNPMERMMLLGALARVVTGAREKAAGMEGGGLESENLLATLAGGAQGYVKGKEFAEKEKTSRMATAQKAATAAAKPDAYESARISLIKSVLGTKPDFTTAAKSSTLLSDAGIDINAYASPRDAWKEYFVRMNGPEAGNTFDRMFPAGGSTSEKVEKQFNTGGEQASAKGSQSGGSTASGNKFKIKKK